MNTINAQPFDMLPITDETNKMKVDTLHAFCYSTVADQYNDLDKQGNIHFSVDGRVRSVVINKDETTLAELYELIGIMPPPKRDKPTMAESIMDRFQDSFKDIEVQKEEYGYTKSITAWLTHRSSLQNDNEPHNNDIIDMEIAMGAEAYITESVFRYQGRVGSCKLHKFDSKKEIKETLKGRAYVFESLYSTVTITAKLEPKTIYLLKYLDIGLKKEARKEELPVEYTKPVAPYIESLDKVLKEEYGDTTSVGTPAVEPQGPLAPHAEKKTIKEFLDKLLPRDCQWHWNNDEMAKELYSSAILEKLQEFINSRHPHLFQDFVARTRVRVLEREKARLLIQACP